MKNTKILFSALIALSITFTACKSAVSESCDGEDLSDDFSCPTDIDAVATFCSDGVSDSYYTYGGEKYECTGVEASTCSKALNDISAKLITEGCSTSKKSGTIKTRLSEIAERLLLDVKTQSLCQ